MNLSKKYIFLFFIFQFLLFLENSFLENNKKIDLNNFINVSLLKKYLNLYEFNFRDDENNIEKLNLYMQSNWFQRGKERWELENFNKSTDILNECNLLLNIIKPEDNTYVFSEINYIIILGATFKSILNRVEYFIKNKNKFSNNVKIIFLTGYREYNEKIDGTIYYINESINNFCKKYNLYYDIDYKIESEEDIMNLFNSILRKNNFNSDIYVESRNINSIRATTESTLNYLLLNVKYKFNDNDRLLFISNGYSINYQKTIVFGIFNKENIFNNIYKNIYFCGNILNINYSEDLIVKIKNEIAKLIYSYNKYFNGK